MMLVKLKGKMKIRVGQNVSSFKYLFKKTYKYEFH
jgi:hypothetical protein